MHRNLIYHLIVSTIECINVNVNTKTVKITISCLASVLWCWKVCVHFSVGFLYVALYYMLLNLYYGNKFILLIKLSDACGKKCNVDPSTLLNYQKLTVVVWHRSSFYVVNQNSIADSVRTWPGRGKPSSFLARLSS